MKTHNMMAVLAALALVACASPSSSSSEGGVSIPDDVLEMAQGQPSRMFLTALMMPPSSSRTETVASVDSRTETAVSTSFNGWSSEYTDVLDFEASGLLRSEGFGTDEARVHAEIDLASFLAEVSYGSGPESTTNRITFEGETLVAFYDGSEVFLDLTDADGLAYLLFQRGIGYYNNPFLGERSAKLRFSVRDLANSGLLPVFPGDQNVCTMQCIDDPATEEFDCLPACEDQEPELEPRGPLTQEEIEAFAASVLPIFNYSLLQSSISGTKLSVTYEATQDDLFEMFEASYLGGYSREDLDEESLQQLDQWVAEAVSGVSIERLFASVTVDLITSVVESLVVDIDVTTGYSYEGELTYYTQESPEAEVYSESYPYTWSYSTSYDVEVSVETSELSAEVPVAVPVNKEEYDLVFLGYQPTPVVY